jgi:hypothetical protein
VLICEYRRQHWEKFGHRLDDALQRLRDLNYNLYYIRKNVALPLAGSPPDSCELFCVPGIASAG